MDTPIGYGYFDNLLGESEIEEIMVEGLESLSLQGQRILVIIPDSTRSMPLPLMFRLLTRHLLGKVAALDFLVALGTHPQMDEAARLALLGITPHEKATTYRDIHIFNHAWKDPQALVAVGVLTADEIAGLTGGLSNQMTRDGRPVDVPVRLNRLILDYDHLLVCGPVFPHEVAGFSGGNKYFFPGIAGSEIIDFTHWLGALVTSYEIIGVNDTPVRRVIDQAAALIPRPRHALCAVVTHEGVSGLFFGTPQSAYKAASYISSQVHIRWMDHSYHRVLSVMPEMYTEIWVGSKGMYKLEPVVADGGEVIIYAPHINEISLVHGALIREIGYHVRDYFVKQWDRFSHYPWGILAHSSHLRGIGSYANGIEQPRIQVTLATGIPPDVCWQINLGYCDPASINPQDWEGRESEGILLAPRAGETLFRLKTGT